jgi:purine-binding chemotaxis protein CheW
MKTETVKLVTFRLGEDLFAADIASVERVLRYTPPSSVPDVPPWVEGVLEHRGSVIPVVDMRRRIGLANVAVTAETRVIVLVTADGRVGGIVDAVNEVAVVPAASVTPPPALFRGLASQFLRGIAKVREQLVVILDVDRVLSSADRLIFEQAVLAGIASPATAGAVVRD